MGRTKSSKARKVLSEKKCYEVVYKTDVKKDIVAKHQAMLASSGATVGAAIYRRSHQSGFVVQMTGQHKFDFQNKYCDVVIAMKEQV